jgi:hypothetical protein
MCSTGYPGSSQEMVTKLYEHVVWADTALKENFKRMPPFLVDASTCPADFPAYVKHLCSIRLLCMAHKVRMSENTHPYPYGIAYL